MPVTLENLRSQTLAVVESWYSQGVINTDMYERYLHAWRVNSFRYSAVGKRFERGPHSELCNCEANHA